MKNSMKKLKIMILGLVFVMVIVISGSTLAANPPIPVHSYVCTLATEQEQQIDDYLLQVMKTGAVPGTAVVIVKDGRPVYMKGFGYADLQAKTPVTPRTMFELASNSKAFTALGVLQLERKGQLKLSDPIRKHLPWFKAKYAGREVDITLEQFLHHTSGMPFKTISYIPESGAENALETTVRKLINIELESSPGTRFAYATINYDVLGLVIAKLSGQSFEEYMKVNVLESLGMNQTYLFRRDALSLAQGYKIGFTKALNYNAPVYRGNTPAGYFISDAEDLAKWLNAQLGLNLSGQVDPELIERSHIPGSSVDAGTGLKYACGWYVNQVQGAPLWHVGENPNYSSSLVIDKTENLGIAVLANMNSAFVHTAAEGIWGLMAGVTSHKFVTDRYKDVDGVAAQVVYILTPLLLLVVFRFVTLVLQIRKRRRSFRKRGLIGVIAAVIGCLLLAGYTYVIYMAPRVIFWGLSWSFLTVWSPISLIIGVVELTCFIYLAITILALPYFFPKQRTNQGTEQTARV